MLQASCSPWRAALCRSLDEFVPHNSGQREFLFLLWEGRGMTVAGTWLGHIRENTPPASMSLGAEVEPWLDHPERERGAGGDDFSAHHPVDTHW